MNIKCFETTNSGCVEFPFAFAYEAAGEIMLPTICVLHTYDPTRGWVSR